MKQYRVAKFYRADIDGLRGIAVTLVILFHMGLSSFSGGFVGVDVFFVISGYLITSILINSISDGSFSIISFYERRIRRIMPALLATVVLSLFVGFFLLTPGDYKKLSISAVSAIGAVSNVFFYYNTGYFDIASDFMPLLHTWSLGVEEQFYFVWPLLLFFAFKIFDKKRHAFLIFILVVTAISFAFSLWQTAVSPKASFFLPFSRAWELSVGGLLVVLPRYSLPRSLSEALPAVGVLLILFSGMYLTEKSSFPGLNAVAPVLGAACLLYDNGNSFAAKFFSLFPFVAIGKISYSLYLVHWPVLAFWRQFAFGIITPGAMVFLCIAMLILATASYYWVEQPFRYSRRSTKEVYIRAILASGLVAGVALFINIGDGLPQRLTPSMRAISDRTTMWEWPCPQVVPMEVSLSWDPSFTTKQLPAFGAPWQTATRHAILWGDSNAEHFLPLFDIAGRDQNVSIALINPCAAILSEGKGKLSKPGDPMYFKQCEQQRASVLRLLHDRKDIDLVILSARWSALPLWFDVSHSSQPDEARVDMFRELLVDTIDSIGKEKKIVIVNDIPMLEFKNPTQSVLADNSYLLRAKNTTDFDKLCWYNASVAQAPIHEVIRSVAIGRENVLVLSPANSLCAEGRCSTWLNGEFLYYDEVHFRRNLSMPTAVQLTDLLGLQNALRF